MAKLKPGDRVSCRIKDNTIVSAYRDYDQVRIFEIIATGDYGYYLFVPQYIFINSTSRIDHYQCRKYGIETRFMGENMFFADEGLIYQVVQKIDGMRCALCQEFVMMAEPNQEDGETFVCFSCRNNPYR